MNTEKARINAFRVLLLFLAAGMYCAAASTRRIRYADLPAALQREFTAAEFPRFIQTEEEATRKRELAGENEHLVYFILQSGHFTLKPRIEPALSAREFVQSGAIPKTVLARMDDFELAMNRPTSDPRLRYFQGFVPGRTLRPYVEQAYQEAMRFLYRKEFGGEAVAPLYQERGHSTDTEAEADFAVWMALSVLKSLDPALKINRALVVGPGLDFAPRTGLMDVFPPQSYQPFALADALLGLKLARADRLRIHCVDISERVVRFLSDFPRSDRKLNIVSGLPAKSLSSDYVEYFEQMGGAIGHQGSIAALPPALSSHLSKSLAIRKEVTQAVSADRLNIVTERYDPPPQYDVVVVTNVFVYFSKQELALALANISAMLKPGGYLIHNELRPEMESLGTAVGLNPIQARTIQMGKQLLDSFVIQKKG